MKHYSIKYHNDEEFLKLVEANKFKDFTNILVQVFTAQNDPISIEKFQKLIINSLPNAELIGATTDGEINSEGAQENSTIISISCFEKTVVKTTLLDGIDCSSDVLGQNIIQSFDKKDVEKSKLAFTFTDGLNTNGEEYLQGINRTNSDILVAGGMAGDRSTFTNTYVFTKDKITTNGAVMAILINPELCYCNDFSFDWEAIGPKHVVTKSDKNIVYTIDDLTAVDFYKKYLGQNVANALPAIGIEFPLVILHKGMEVARAVVNKNDDGSLVFAGNVKEGSVVKFGFGNVNKIVENGSKTITNILNASIEGIYIYSCMARKHLLGSDVNIELHPLSKIANVAGFFTYGEFFYRDHSTFLLNQSMTVIGISESCPKDFYCGTKGKAEVATSSVHDKDNVLRLEALSNLVTQTSADFDILNENLHNKVKEEVEKNLEKDALMQLNAKHAQLGEMMEMILHQWRQPLSVMKTIITGAQMEQKFGSLTEEKKEQNRKNLLENIEHLSATVQDFRDFFNQNSDRQVLKPAEILEKVKLFTYPLCKKESIEYKTTVKYDEDIEVDSSKLVQAIMNITKNAIDALIENRHYKYQRVIHSIIENDSKSLIIKIEDNAGGIPEDILPKIFEKRFTTKSKEGTGIGLHMTKTIIETHLKGSIEVLNLKEGAQFILKLPL